MKKIYSIILFFVLLLGVSGCANQVMGTNINIDNVNKINVFSGSIGKLVEIVNDEQIEYITNNF